MFRKERCDILSDGFGGVCWNGSGVEFGLTAVHFSGRAVIEDRSSFKPFERPLYVVTRPRQGRDGGRKRGGDWE